MCWRVVSLALPRGLPKVPSPRGSPGVLFGLRPPRAVGQRCPRLFPPPPQLLGASSPLELRNVGHRAEQHTYVVAIFVCVDGCLTATDRVALALTTTGWGGVLYGFNSFPLMITSSSAYLVLTTVCFVVVATGCWLRAPGARVLLTFREVCSF